MPLFTGFVRRPEFEHGTIIEHTFRDLDLADDAIAITAEHGLQKTDFQRRAKVKDAEPIGPDPTVWVTESRRVLPEPERIRKRLSMDAPELRHHRDGHEIEGDVVEGGRRWRTWH